MSLRLKDIAERLNISQATVSLVLNNKPGVSQETREKVLKTAAEMGYNIDALLRMSSDKNKNIRFIIYKKHGKIVSDTPFFSALIEGIEQEARNNDYNLSISYIQEKDAKTEIKKLSNNGPFDGIILLATEMTREDLNLFSKFKIPIVVLDSFFKGIKYDTIAINNLQGSYEGTKYLIDCGHTKIGYLCSSIWINNFEERKEGYLKALRDHGLKVSDKFIFNLEPTLDGAYNDMLKLLNTNPELPTAFFSDNDIIAFGAMKAIKEKNIRIPDDISIVGFDDMPFCEMTEPALTTVKVYKQSMGRLAVKRLIERIEGDCEAFVKIEVNTELVERSSVKVIPE